MRAPAVRRSPSIVRLLLPVIAALGACRTMPDTLVYEGGSGPGAGKHIVFVAGDEEYRSEEALPCLARILAVRHGFKCTVLFSTSPQTGEIDPENRAHIPGLSALDEADLLVLFTRFRRLPDEDMARIARWVEGGGPLIAIRTATHAFEYEDGSASAFARYDWNGGPPWPGGFGRQLLGETWVAHHGRHGGESTRGVAATAASEHPILRGVSDVWGPTDVYAVGALPDDATVLLHGLVLAGMSPDDAPVDDGRNAPPMPLVWTRERAIESVQRSADGQGPKIRHEQRIVCSTIGASVDLRSEDLRRLFVNAAYWCLGMADAIPERSNADLVGEYEPTMFGFGTHRRGVKPQDLALPR